MICSCFCLHNCLTVTNVLHIFFVSFIHHLHNKSFLVSVHKNIHIHYKMTVKNDLFKEADCVQSSLYQKLHPEKHRGDSGKEKLSLNKKKLPARPEPDSGRVAFCFDRSGSEGTGKGQTKTHGLLMCGFYGPGVQV